jgi:hypothetical protein
MQYPSHIHEKENYTMKTFKAITGLAVAATVLAAGAANAQTLVDRYTFNDIGSTVVDSVGVQNGTLANGATESGGSLLTTGAGTGAAAPSAQFGSYTLPTGAVTIEDFFTPTAANGGGAYPTLFSFSTSPTKYLLGQVGRGGASNPAAALDVTLTSTTVSSSPYVIGQVNQFVSTYDGTNETLYLNGVQVGQTAQTAFPSANNPTAPFNGIGGNSPYNDSSLQGSTEDFRIFSGALTLAQVKADFAGGPNTVVTGAPVPEASSSIGLGVLLALGGLALVARKRPAKA